jgi:serine/threonine protein kinase
LGRFSEEAENLSRLQHPGVVRVYELETFARPTSSDLSGVKAPATRADFDTATTDVDSQPSSTRMWSSLPTRLGDYEVIEQIGRGGMGAVFKVRDVALDRLAALKISSRHLGAADGEGMDRFFRAARLWARLNHPSIVAIYHVDQFDGMPYIVSEFIEGVDLSTLVRSGGLSVRDAAGLIAEVADALEFAHGQGILHRDVKPSNIMIEPDGHTVLVDFGLACSLSADDEASITVVGNIIGTPTYMSPEQVEGRHDLLEPATDVYSLGATLYTLLAGRPPFQGRSILETLRQIPEVEPEPPRQLNPTVPRDLEAICLKALRKRPADRYATAHAMAEDLRRFLDGRPILARPPGTPERLVRWLRQRSAWFAVFLVALASLALISHQQFELQKARRRLVPEGLELRRTINRTSEGELRTAVELGEARIRDHRQGREGGRRLASSYHRLGDLLVNTDRLSDAVWAYQRAITLLQQHLRDEGEDAESRTELADVFSNLGEASYALGWERDARAAFREALIIRQRLVGDRHRQHPVKP